MTLAADFVAALKRNERQAAVTIVRQMISMDAPMGDQWRAIGQFAANSGEWSLAIIATRKYLASSPTDTSRIVMLGGMFAESGQLHHAVALVEPALKMAPADGRLSHLLGTAFLQLGERDRGLAFLETAARLLPDSAPTWLAIAGARNFRDDQAGFIALRDAGAKFARATPEARSAYHYAVGKALVDRSDAAGAFAAYEKGAELARTLRPYDAFADTVAAERLVNCVTRSWLDASAMDAAELGAPIFVTGLPRSGTTLVEQMLASHSAVADGGELNLLGIAAETVGGIEPTALRQRLAACPTPDAAWFSVRALYLHLLEERRHQPGRMIDKSLNISRFAHLVRLALPEARILWLRRDPMDVAWSCFRTHFQSGLGWTFSLEDMGQHFAAEDLLFEHWRDVLSDRILVVPYADLVADADSWARRIAEHAGLPFEPAMLDFHNTRRTVATASVDQVRRPIYRDAIGASQPYASYMAPFMESYAKARKALGLSAP